jgi:DNA-binding Lrp family transcriptional regulator
MTAKSLDIYVLAKLLLEEQPRPYGVVAGELGMSASEYHAAVRRLGVAGLIDAESRAIRKRPTRDFLFHGLRYVFPATRGELNRGLPTSFAAPPLANVIAAGSNIIPIWPTADGERLGYTIDPLHPSAPKAAVRNSRFYELLALLDALREGRPRESRLAMEEIDKRLRDA